MRKRRLQRGVESLREHGARNAAFYIFCAFIVSYFGRLAKRVPLLGAIHFDLVLAALALAAIIFTAPRGARTSRRDVWAQMDPVARRLWILLGYIAVTLPFVEWPGSVLHNLEPYLKSVCFFFFVVATVDTTSKLRTLLFVYTATQVWRVLEPLYMHFKSGYWGDYASLGNWEYMNRLSGSPSDIINPNGLGFVIIMTLPILHFLIKPDTALRRILWAATALAMCYALVLSASRSSFLAFVFLCLFAIWRTRHRVVWLTVGVIGAVLAVALMTGLQRDRYISIFSDTAPGAVTAQTRITGVIEDFKISLRRPLFGHGIGTSREANGRFRGADMPSHNLYTETAEELGYVGLAIVLALIWSFLRACWTAQQAVAVAPASDERLRFLHSVARALIAVVAVDLFFSFAAFGLGEPYWYFIGGLSVVTARLARKLSPAAAELPVSRRGARSLRWRFPAPRRGARPRRGTAPGFGAH